MDKPVLAHTNSPENNPRKQKMSFPVIQLVSNSMLPHPGPTRHKKFFFKWQIPGGGDK